MIAMKASEIAAVVQGKLTGEDVIVTQIMGPAVGIKDSGITFGVQGLKLRRLGVVEVGQRPFL